MGNLKSISIFILAGLILFAYAYPAAAEVRVGILPPKVNALEKPEYYRDAAFDFLALRVKEEGKIATIKLQPTSGDPEVASEFSLNPELTHLLCGVITVSGHQVIMDWQLFDRAAPAAPKLVQAKAENEEEFLPKLQEVAGNLRQALGGTGLHSSTSSQAAPEPKVLLEIPGALTALIPFQPTPDRKLLALIMQKKVQLFDLKEGKLIDSVTYSGSTVDNFVSGCAADVDGDGMEELWLNNFQGGALRSLALKFSGAALKPVLKHSLWYIKSVADHGRSFLIGQAWRGEGEFQGAVYRIEFKKRVVVKGEKIPLPDKRFGNNFNVLNYNLIDINGDGTSEIYYVSPMRNLYVFDRKGNLLVKGLNEYGGSLRYYVVKGDLKGEDEYVYLEHNGYVFPGAQAGTEELLALRNESSLPVQLSRQRFYRQGEIIRLKFDGFDLKETKVFSYPGALSDFYFQAGGGDQPARLYAAQVVSRFPFGGSSTRLILLEKPW